jgi:hypothetical protein
MPGGGKTLGDSHAIAYPLYSLCGGVFKFHTQTHNKMTAIEQKVEKIEQALSLLRMSNLHDVKAISAFVPAIKAELDRLYRKHKCSFFEIYGGTGWKFYPAETEIEVSSSYTERGVTDMHPNRYVDRGWQKMTIKGLVDIYKVANMTNIKDDETVFHSKIEMCTWSCNSKIITYTDRGIGNVPDSYYGYIQKKPIDTGINPASAQAKRLIEEAIYGKKHPLKRAKRK